MNIPNNSRDCIFWGKFDETRGCLPLTAHCLDVALTFRALVDLPGFRRALEVTAGRRLDARDLDRLAVFAMLHDVGKANLGFQVKVFDPKAPRAGHVRELAPLFDDDVLRKRFADAIDVSTLSSWCREAESLLLASWSHHGRPVRFDGARTGTYFEAKQQWWQPHDQWDPMVAVSKISALTRQLFPEAYQPVENPLPTQARFHHRFAGLVMLADWLGSHSHYFPIEAVDTDARREHDNKVIPHMLRAVGLDVSSFRRKSANVPATFRGRFGFDPYPLQAAVHALDPHDPTTQILIAESDTGSGKTEAALDWFITLFTSGLVDALYFALPTRVAARELYGRVHRCIARLFPNASLRPVTVLAVPGYTQVDGFPVEKSLPGDESRCQDDADQRRRERQWAGERPKRFLAATVAVGTIDQVLLSAVQTPHAHLRSVCLDRSLLVVDEVHASDTYMSRLLSHLLEHHLATGGRAMLLSATLGSCARSHFLKAAGVSAAALDLEHAVSTPYPALTMADGRPRCAGVALENSRQVIFELLPIANDPQKIAARVVQALCADARVLVVMNTVARANSVLRAIEATGKVPTSAMFTCAGVVSPHHGHFAPTDRLLLDRELSARLGPGSPAGPVAVIGTQTLEQSLDIDADVLVTDLAPADVLLQRLGRLHRHRRPRPADFEVPRCHLLVPNTADLESALDARGHVRPVYKRLGYGSVYEDLRTLELTRRLLARRPRAVLPQENRTLVEEVTHPDRLASLVGDRWSLHGQNVAGGNLAEAIAATNVAAIYDKLFGDFVFNEAETRVTTRLGADSLRLPLASPILGPFGQQLTEIVIPGHMAPKRPEERVAVKQEDAGVLSLRCAERRYRYSRFGLEAEE